MFENNLEKSKIGSADRGVQFLQDRGEMHALGVRPW
jgi:hypothetical protein